MAEIRLSKVAATSWSRIACPVNELRLDITLRCGQAFRWSRLRVGDAGGDDDVEKSQWIGVMGRKVWILSQNATELLFKAFPAADGDAKALSDYFQLDVNLRRLYKTWSTVDAVFSKVSDKFPGIRMLRQDPVENLFSFICSSNNNIQRISGMVEKMCVTFGDQICTLVVDEPDVEIGDRKPAAERVGFYTFPNVDTLAGAETTCASNKDVQVKLRGLGFGYRADFVAKSADKLRVKGGESYLLGLRNLDYPAARAALLDLPGVGPKVADCVLLMSLDKPSAIPVDTHMFQIAASKYLPHLKAYKSVTDRVYQEIGDHFRHMYGDHAGWAHSVLFSSDLRHLKANEGSTSEDHSRSKKKRRKLSS